jgi:hypothetical protein
LNPVVQMLVKGDIRIAPRFIGCRCGMAEQLAESTRNNGNVPQGLKRLREKLVVRAKKHPSGAKARVLMLGLTYGLKPIPFVG